MTRLTRIKIGAAKPLRAAAAYVRMSVFVIERNIKLLDEFDDKDSDQMVYGVLFDGKIPATTCRFEKYDQHTLRIGRIATLEQFRGKRYGTQLVLAMEDFGRQQGFVRSLIHSEVTAENFYNKLGYFRVAKPFIEDGVKCVLVTKAL